MEFLLVCMGENLFLGLIKRASQQYSNIPDKSDTMQNNVLTLKILAYNEASSGERFNDQTLNLF